MQTLLWAGQAGPSVDQATAAQPSAPTDLQPCAQPSPPCLIASHTPVQPTSTTQFDGVPFIRHQSSKQPITVLNPGKVFHIPRSFLVQHFDFETVLRDGLDLQVKAGGVLDPDVVHVSVAAYQNQNGYSYHRLLGFRGVARKYKSWCVQGWQAPDAKTVRICLAQHVSQASDGGAGGATDRAAQASSGTGAHVPAAQHHPGGLHCNPITSPRACQAQVSCSTQQHLTHQGTAPGPQTWTVSVQPVHANDGQREDQQQQLLSNQTRVHLPQPLAQQPVHHSTAHFSASSHVVTCSVANAQCAPHTQPVPGTAPLVLNAAGRPYALVQGPSGLVAIPIVQYSEPGCTGMHSCSSVCGASALIPEPAVQPCSTQHQPDGSVINFLLPPSHWEQQLAKPQMAATTPAHQPAAASQAGQAHAGDALVQVVSSTPHSITYHVQPRGSQVGIIPQLDVHEHVYSAGLLQRPTGSNAAD